jgi:hypothetical protein
MSTTEIAGTGDASSAPSNARTGDRHLLGRKSVLMGMLASGFVIADAAQPSSASAGTTKPGAIAAATPIAITKWLTATTYVLGQQIVTPNNDVASANVAHTSSAAFTTDTALWTRGGSGTNTAKWTVPDAGLFVSATAGSDASDGLSPGSAKRTIAAAMAALAGGKGVITLGSGTYNEQNLPLSNGLTIRGSNSTVISSSGDTFTVAANTERYDVRIENVIINTSGSAFAIAGALVLSNINCQIWQSTGTSPAISATGLVDTYWDVQIEGTSPAKVPLIRLINHTSATSICRNSFTGRITHSGSFGIHIEDATGSSYASNNRIYDMNFEVPNSGAIRILSGMGNVIDNVGIFDLTAAATNLIYLGKSATSTLKSVANRIASYFRLGGSLARSNYDVNLDSGNAPSTTLITCGATAGFAVNWGGNNAVSVDTGIGSTGSAYVAGVSDVGLRHVVESYSNWYAASAVGAGTSFFDTTHNKVLTSDGTNWRDGVGTVVV